VDPCCGSRPEKRGGLSTDVRGGAVAAKGRRTRCRSRVRSARETAAAPGASPGMAWITGCRFRRAGVFKPQYWKRCPGALGGPAFWRSWRPGGAGPSTGLGLTPTATYGPAGSEAGGAPGGGGSGPEAGRGCAAALCCTDCPDDKGTES